MPVPNKDYTIFYITCQYFFEIFMFLFPFTKLFFSHVLKFLFVCGIILM